MRTLVLGLGNELIADDAVGLLAVRRLRDQLNGEADVLESSLSGIALVELLVGYDRVILVDAMQTGRTPAGTIHEFAPDDFRAINAPSPHYAGIPEILALARELNLDFPTDISIIAIEAADLSTLGGGLSTPVAEALNELVDRIRALLDAPLSQPLLRHHRDLGANCTSSA